MMLKKIKVVRVTKEIREEFMASLKKMDDAIKTAST